jgi:hypothetical protein
MTPLEMTMMPDKAVNTHTKHETADPGSIAMSLSRSGLQNRREMARGTLSGGNEGRYMSKSCTVKR